MALDIIIKLLIGFTIFFAGVIFNVKIMSSKNPSPLMAKLSLVFICVGLIVLVTMANNIDFGKIDRKAVPEETSAETQWF